MLTPGLMQGPPGSADERRLVRSFRRLDPASRQTLLAFAEFLAERTAQDSETAAVQPVPEPTPEPRPEPRPAQESVVAAIKRLRRSYPMLDGGTMLQETSQLMAAHVLQGRDAGVVIDELEVLFARRFNALTSPDPKRAAEKADTENIGPESNDSGNTDAN